MTATAAVIGIFGATASGKSAVAEELARRTGAGLVSADAMQVYRGLPILTNQSEHPTELVGIWPLGHEASVGAYQALAHAAIDRMRAAGRLAVVVGGSGLYFRAALADLALPPAPPAGSRVRWEALYDERGATHAHALLAERDPAAAAAVHPNDRRRVVRALELADGGSSLRPERDRLWAGETRHPTLVVGLEVAQDVLERMIGERTREMYERGVEEEVRLALAGNVSETARQVHGLTEVAELPREQAIEAIIVATRRYAAYQRKWMRRIPSLVSLAADRPTAHIADEILELAGAREHLRAGRAR